MATVAFGLIGAGLGSAIPGVGTGLGWAIGTEIGGFIDAGNRPPIEVGKLNDLHASSSQYGASIIRQWGSDLIPGNVFWLANYLNGVACPTGTEGAVQLLEHEQSSGGGCGVGAPSQDSFSYTATYLVGFLVGTYMNPDGSFVTRNPILKQFKCNDEVVWDADQDSALNKVTLSYKTGTEDQVPFSRVITHEGLVNTPADRGICTVLIEDQLLTPYGNQIPICNAVWDTDEFTCGDIISDLCRASNVKEEFIDTSLITDTMTQYSASSVNSGQSLLNPLLQMKFIDQIEVDWTLKYIPRGTDIVRTIDSNDLGAKLVNDSSTQLLQKLARQLDEIDLIPAKTIVNFKDLNNGFQQGSQPSSRQISSDDANTEVYDFDYVMTSNEAKQLADRLNDVKSAEAEGSFPFSLPHTYIDLCPSSPIYLPHNNQDYRIRILDMEFGEPGEIRFNVVIDDDAALIQDETGGSSGVEHNKPSVPVPSIFTAWSGKELQDADQVSAGFYVAATGVDKWIGGQVKFSTDGGTTYVNGPFINRRSIFGTTTSTLGDPPASVVVHCTTDAVIGASSIAINALSGPIPINAVLQFNDNKLATLTANANTSDITISVKPLVAQIDSGDEATSTWDETNTVDVSINDDNQILSNVTADEVESGVNNAVIFNSSHNEIVGFVNADLTGSLSYTLSSLKRNRRNSVGTGHTSSDQFVVASRALVRVRLSDSFTNSEVYVKVVSPYQLDSDVDPVIITIAKRTPVSVDLGGDVTGGQSQGVIYISDSLKTEQDADHFSYDKTSSTLSVTNVALTNPLSPGYGGTGLDTVIENEILIGAAGNTVSQIGIDSTLQIVGGNLGIVPGTSVDESFVIAMAVAL